MCMAVYATVWLDPVYAGSGCADGGLSVRTSPHCRVEHYSTTTRAAILNHFTFQSMDFNAASAGHMHA